MKIVLEDVVQAVSEDGGRARIAYDFAYPVGGFFVRLHSWDESKEHKLMKALEGGRVKLTIEVL